MVSRTAFLTATPLSSTISANTLLPRRRPAPHAPPGARNAAPLCRLGNRALGVDYGLRRVGLAVSVGVSPRQLAPVLHRNDPAVVALAVARAAAHSVCTTIVVGMPVEADGHGHGVQGRATERFIEKLRVAAPWARIDTLDERFTTIEAHARLSEMRLLKKDRAMVIDGVAATILLERYFDDKDDIRGVMVQEGQPEDTVRNDQNADRKGFYEWREEARERARILADQLRRQR